MRTGMSDDSFQSIFNLSILLCVAKSKHLMIKD